MPTARPSRLRAALTALLAVLLVVGVVGAGYLVYRMEHLTDRPFDPVSSGSRVPDAAQRSEVTAVAEQFAQPAEELRAEPAQLLDLAGERHVQLAAEIGDRDLLLLDLLLLEIERRHRAGASPAELVELRREYDELLRRR